MRLWATWTKRVGNLRQRMYTWHYRRLFSRVGRGTAFGGRVHYRYPENITIGDHCRISEESFLDGRASIILGSHVVLSPFVMIMTGGLDQENVQYSAEPIHIEDNVWIATNAIVLQGVRIGKGARVGAGAVVTRDVAAGETVAGVPARPLQAAPVS